MPLLLDLPDELLAAIPPFVRNIEDLNNARSSCRKLRRLFSAAAPNIILNLAAASAPTFFNPHPYFLVMATARQTSDWVLADPAIRTPTLQHHLQGGIDSLLDLCLRVAGLTLDDIRALHEARFAFVNPLADRIDKMAGAQWYATPDFWNGGVSEPATLHTESDRTTFQYLIYGELFASSMAAYLQPELKLPRLGLDVRLDYVKYCIPDWICAGGYPGLEVKRTGPYAPGGDVEMGPWADQTTMQFVLETGRWQRLWAPLLRSVGPDLQSEWRQKLWWAAVVETQGMWAARALFCGPSSAQRRRLCDIRRLVEQLDDHCRPRDHHVGDNLQLPVSEAPEFAAETLVCMRRMWPGT